jgi:hypothetical protein
MASIDLHPAWVGVLDFQSRLPSALGGISCRRRDTCAAGHAAPRRR